MRHTFRGCPAADEVRAESLPAGGRQPTAAGPNGQRLSRKEIVPWLAHLKSVDLIECGDLVGVSFIEPFEFWVRAPYTGRSCGGANVRSLPGASHARKKGAVMRTMTDQEIGLLKELGAAGILFLVSPVFGYVELSAGEVKTYLEDPDAFMARQHDVSVDLFLDWRAFAGDPRCRATTRKGRPCESSLPVPNTPAQFRPGLTDYCRVHQEHI